MGSAAALLEELDTAIAAVRAVITELASRPGVADDPESLADLDVLTVGLQTRHDRLALAQDTAIHAWQQQRRWTTRQHLRAHWGLSLDTHTSERTAAHRLARARLLHEAIVVAAAVQDGLISIDHVDLLMRVATKERLRHFLAHQQMLVELLVGAVTFDEARQIARYWADRVDEELGRGPRLNPPSTASFSRDEITGQGRLTAQLHPLEAEVVGQELDRLMAEIRQEDEAVGRTRPPRERRAAALLRMASRSASTEHGDRPRALLQILVGADHVRRLCELASGAVLHPDDLAGHLGDALVESVIFDGPTTLVATTRQRTLVGAMRRAIMARDRRCQHHAGCYHRARDADIGHRRPFGPDTPTGQHTVQAECHGHNRIPHLHSDTPIPPEPCITVLDLVRVQLRHRLEAEQRRAAEDGTAEPNGSRLAGHFDEYGRWHSTCSVCGPHAEHPQVA